MLKKVISDQQLPDDPSGTAVGVALRVEDIDQILRPGLEIIQATMPTLADKTKEILEELEDLTKPLTQTSMRLVKIDRELSKKHLRKGELKVLNCDKRKVFALIGALLSTSSSRGSQLASEILENLTQSGIPIKVEGKPEIGGSIFIKIFDESVELKLIRPA